jgi:hypothetical protein
MYLDFAKHSYKSEFGRKARRVSNIAISDVRGVPLMPLAKPSR